MCAYVCLHVCARLYARVISGLKHPLRIFADPLNAYTLYTHQNPQFMSYGTIYLCFYSQETWRNDEASDRAI